MQAKGKKKDIKSITTLQLEPKHVQIASATYIAYQVIKWEGSMMKLFEIQQKATVIGAC